MSLLITTYLVFKLARPCISSEVEAKILHVAFAEVFLTNAINVSDVRGSSDVYLALVDVVLQFFLSAFPQGFIGGGVIGHGPGEDCGIVLVGWLVGCCMLLAVARTNLANAFSHELRM